MDDGRSSWIPVTPVGDLDEVRGSEFDLAQHWLVWAFDSKWADGKSVSLSLSLSLSYTHSLSLALCSSLPFRYSDKEKNNFWKENPKSHLTPNTLHDPGPGHNPAHSIRHHGWMVTVQWATPWPPAYGTPVPKYTGVPTLTSVTTYPWFHSAVTTSRSLSWPPSANSSFFGFQSDFFMYSPRNFLTNVTDISVLTSLCFMLYLLWP